MKVILASLPMGNLDGKRKIADKENGAASLIYFNPLNNKYEIQKAGQKYLESDDNLCGTKYRAVAGGGSFLLKDTAIKNTRYPGVFW